MRTWVEGAHRRSSVLPGTARPQPAPSASRFPPSPAPPAAQPARWRELALASHAWPGLSTLLGENLLKVSPASHHPLLCSWNPLHQLPSPGAAEGGRAAAERPGLGTEPLQARLPDPRAPCTPPALCAAPGWARPAFPNSKCGVGPRTSLTLPVSSTHRPPNPRNLLTLRLSISSERSGRVPRCPNGKPVLLLCPPPPH